MTVILSFPDYYPQAEQLAEVLSLPCHKLQLHTFPDNESKVTIPFNKQQHVIIYCGLEDPNTKLVELMLTVRTLKDDMGCQRVSLISPYLCYMRQDKAFHPGEVVSQKIIAGFLDQLFDDLLTIDAHLHRIGSLQEIFNRTNTVHISAAQRLGEFLAAQKRDYLLLGPDEESLQWVRQVAEAGQFSYDTARKTRHGDYQVNIELPQLDFSNHDIVLVDDVISSGGTMIEVARLLSDKGINSLHALVSHALYHEPTANKLFEAGIQTVWSSDSIPHSSNTVSLINDMAQHVQQWIVQ